jgi:tetratricopeptide (TPR) repeat protein
MRVSILLVYLTMLAAAGIAGGSGAGLETEPQRPEPRVQSRQESPVADDPDALYAQRENIESAKRAAEMWADAVRRNPRDFEAAWKLARARYYLGGHVPAAERKAQYSLGVEAARLAVAAQPNRPEGHFWLGSSLGGLGQLSTWAGLKYRNTIKDEFETVVRLDPGWDKGSGFIALGRWYLQVPSLFGGSKTKSEDYLRRALAHDPYGTIVHYFLAETLLGLGRATEARSELEKAIEASVDPDYVPEDREWKQKAKELLRKIAQQPPVREREQPGAPATGDARSVATRERW